ncbi:MAG: hypothetical protein WBP61_12110 [Nocardioides sp.]
MSSRRGLQATVVLVVLALLGGLVAVGISHELGIRAEDKVVPVEDLVPAPPRAAVPPPQLTVDATAGLRTRTAVAELQEAVAAAPGTRGAAALVVRHGDGDTDDDTYRLTGSADRMRISADSETGAVRGIYDLALAAREGRPLTEHLGEEVTSRMPFRMVELGAAGVVPDPSEWIDGDDYSHHSKAFEDVMLDEAPYIDQEALAVARASVYEYAEHVLAEGYNAVAIWGFLEYVTFADIDGVYDADDDHVARAEAMRAAFGPIFERLDRLGLKVYLRTDMLALTTPLEEYLTRDHPLDPEDPELWDLYAAGLDEVYEALPTLDGVLIRIGEAGTVYNLDGWDYYSDLAVTTVPAVRAMLEAFVAQAERADREVIFRTWSVGVGAVGDMHTNQESYRAVLDGIDSDNLIVSTKYTLGDYYSYLPLNDTLDIGSQRRIVELQSRREFEAYGALPNDLGVLYQEALEHFLESNPRVEGIWTWTQDGGPWRAGPMTLELTSGFWQLYELNTVLAARLARDPGADPATITADWARRWFSGDRATVGAISDAMALSREAVTHGLYIEPFAEKRGFAMGLEPPPMMWIFEWDIITGDSAVLDVMYAISKDRLEEAIAEGDDAVATAEEMRDLVAGTDPATWSDPVLREHFVDTLDYQVNLLELLAAYRTMFLRHAQWLDTGSGDAREAWSEARERFEAVAATHEERYDRNVDLPAFNLTAARIGEARAARDLPMAWFARGGLLLVLGLLALTRTGRTLVRSALTPWRRPAPTNRWLLVGIPVLAVVWSRLAFTWFLAPAHLLLVGIGWAALVVAVALTRSWWVATAVGGAVTLRALLLLGVLSIRGPGGYWFMFWAEPGWRTAYVVVSFMLFGWVLACLIWSLAGAIGHRRSTAVAVGVVGAVLLAIGVLLETVGLERSLSTWNDQLSLLPWGLARILGLAVYLGIPAALPWYVIGAGTVLVLGALALGLPGRRHAVEQSVREPVAR